MQNGLKKIGPEMVAPNIQTLTSENSNLAKEAMTIMTEILTRTHLTDQTNWHELALRISQMGYRVTPVRLISGKPTPRPFALGQNYLSGSDYQDALYIGVILDRRVLVDWDGYNQGATTKQTLIERFGELPTIAQERLGKASEHYVYELPDEVELADLSQSNNGVEFPFVDIKTGNQLIYVKPGKELDLEALRSPPSAPKALVDILAKTEGQKAERGFDLVANLTKFGDEDWVALEKAALSIPKSFFTQREPWLRLGMALKSFADTDYEERALELFHKICEEEYPSEEDYQERVDLWEKHISAEGGITYSSIFHWAKESNAGKSATTPPHVRDALVTLATKLEISPSELCEQIEFEPETLDQIISSCAYDQNKSKFLVLALDGEMRFFLRTEIYKGLYGTFSAPYDKTALKNALNVKASKNFPEDNQRTERSRFVKDLLLLIDRGIVDHVLINRQFAHMAVKVDMFAKTASVELERGRAKLTFPHRPFLQGLVDQRLVDDYKTHFPKIDEFLDLLAAARFATSRKKAYLWVKAESDWGKGFLSGALSALGLVVSMSPTEVEKIFSGGPVGRVLEDFLGSWILEFNEFKQTKGELKQLEQEMYFSPKGLPVCKTPLYLKLFFSAEHVDSLASVNSGIEDQFANRFSLLTPEGKINERPLFLESIEAYSSALRNYVAAYLNAKVQEYRALGLKNACDHGDRVVEAWHRQYGISNTYERLSEKIEPLSQQFMEWVADQYISALKISKSYGFGNRNMTKTEQEVFANGFTKGFELYLKRPGAIISLWLEAEFDQSERGKLAWKRSELKDMLPKVDVIRVNKYENAKAMLVATLPKEVEDLLPRDDDQDDTSTINGGKEIEMP